MDLGEHNQNRKACPMKFGGQNSFAQDAWCEKEECAWWISCDNNCAVTLSRATCAQQERENPKPLTLEELQEMDGEPVWVEFHLGLFPPVWMLVNAPEQAAYDSLHQKVDFSCYGDAWLAYWQKPKEGTKS